MNICAKKCNAKGKICCKNFRQLKNILIRDIKVICVLWDLKEINVPLNLNRKRFK